MSTQRRPPTILPPLVPPEHVSRSAAFIFVHGLGDDAAGVETIARQFQAAGKLPYLTWVLPNALENREAMQTAWYIPTRLSSFPLLRPELEDEEDEQGMRESRDYIASLIDDLTAQGVPARRIVLGGFSQGHAMALLVGLTSKCAGKLGGLVGLSGYLPLAEKIGALRKEAGLAAELDDDVEVFIARGNRDMLVPRRYLTICTKTLVELGVRESKMTVREYEGMGHVMGGEELRHLCSWLEEVVPPVA